MSFTKNVAPILVNRCGRCHVSDSKGDFNMGTFAALMKGPPEGVVIFAGDTVGSRLIETIETGDMPRGGGKVTPDELKLLKEWIKFRRETVTRRLEFRLDKVLERLHILDGLLIAYLNIDDVIKIIRENDDPKPVLMKIYSLFTKSTWL